MFLLNKFDVKEISGCIASWSNGMITVTDSSTFGINGVIFKPNAVCLPTGCITNIFDAPIEANFNFSFNGLSNVIITATPIQGGAKYTITPMTA